MSESFFLPIQKQLRYRILGELNEGVKHIVIILHGYGQLVEFFSKKFEDEITAETLFVFPEGTHRFYLKGTSGRVGASWMTRELRELDIEENAQQLSALYAHLFSTYPSAKLTVLGFSQGGATAARWLALKQINCAHFISWASVFPPDLNNESTGTGALKQSFVLGNKDPFYSEEDQKAVLADYAARGFDCYTFEGNHDIDIELFKELIA